MKCVSPTGCPVQGCDDECYLWRCENPHAPIQAKCSVCGHWFEAEPEKTRCDECRPAAAFAVAAVLSLAACAPMPHTQVAGPDFSQFKVTEHRVSPAASLARCYRHIPVWQKAVGTFALACAEVDFPSMTCSYWCFSDYTCRHELLHCQGYDHGGTLQRAWNAYVDSQLSRRAGK